MNLQYATFQIAKFEHEERIQRATRQNFWRQITAGQAKGSSLGWMMVLRSMLGMKVSRKSLPRREECWVEAAFGD